ncbi:MAG: hypothetical protein COA52_00810 [Hyphomicrobiales bacterium]|nr:MAG: hypothetical protein COA52_00810 [Hyphomicrobiales bacterium]
MPETIYSDLKRDFERHPVKRDITLATNEIAVKNSIINLIFTGPYERYRKPTLGAGIPQDLFENISPETEYQVEKRIEETITNYEPRANLISVKALAQNDLNNYVVTITFSVKNSFDPITISQILRRIR